MHKYSALLKYEADLKENLTPGVREIRTCEQEIDNFVDLVYAHLASFPSG